jgi:hypothetical protein
MTEDEKLERRKGEMQGVLWEYGYGLMAVLRFDVFLMYLDRTHQVGEGQRKENNKG